MQQVKRAKEHYFTDIIEKNQLLTFSRQRLIHVKGDPMSETVIKLRGAK